MTALGAAPLMAGAVPLHVYSGGFLTQTGLRAALQAAGWDVRLGTLPMSRDAHIGVWGQKPVSRRGRWIARQTGHAVLTIEDGFLRSVYPGDRAVPPLSLILDDIGIYYDARRPSRLEAILQNGAPELDQRGRAADGIALLRKLRLSKYTPPMPDPAPEPGYVLVIDQTAGDASIPGAGATAEHFSRMLDAARIEHPGKCIVVKTHPDVIAGRKNGHFSASDLREGDQLLAAEVNPWDVIDGAAAVYTVSSQLGYEAVLAGKPVRCFGAAFYAGWGLSSDEMSTRRRTTSHTRETLFAACHLAYPVYYDPWHQRLCSFEDAANILSHLVNAEQRSGSQAGEVFGGVRLWKRRNLAQFRPRFTMRPKFATETEDARKTAQRENRKLWLWASRASANDPPETGYVEDGFLRSVGLGAELTHAASLVFDRSGIYYDPNRASDLEHLIEKAAKGAADIDRASALMRSIVSAGLTKYNVGQRQQGEGAAGKQVILVPGQVEDDASIRLGAGEVRTNLALLQVARDANPDAYIIYKPHPDVEAGLRTGAIAETVATRLADEIARDASPIDLLDRSDALWTMTSLMGFEALMRDVPVTCLGMPFYAGWGLTQDLGPECPRRTSRPTLPQLIWATLIAYPRYVDPISGLPCTPELIVERLASGQPFQKATLLSRLQSAFAGCSWIWR